jgi:hypothetical protein
MSNTEKIDMLINQMIRDYLLDGNVHGIDKMIDDWYVLRFEGEQTVKSDVIKEKMKIRFRDRFQKDFLTILKTNYEKRN